MARICMLVAIAALVLFGGCKAIEGGYEDNKEKQSAKTDKILKEDE